MRIAVVSDVHANLAALEAVLRHAEARNGLDAIWSLGDFVGYGPQPNEILDLLRRYPLVGVAGNHDRAATGAIDTSEFNEAAAIANAWNAHQLSDESAAFLRELPEVVLEPDAAIVCCHGSLRFPIWEYMYTDDAALAQFERMTTPYSFVGHTHIPLVVREVGSVRGLEAFQPNDGEVVGLGKERLILNPGGVGQPRDGDPRAAYALLDTQEQTVSYFRVAYEIEKTQALMRAAGLPPRLIKRLSAGR
jgi:predicted phosphodiesterase